MNRKKLLFIKSLFLVTLTFVLLNCSGSSADDDTEEEIMEEIMEEEEEEEEVVDETQYTTVNTIAELNTKLNVNDVNIKMAPGTYRFGPDDITSGLIPFYEMFVFRGNNSNYDFTDVTFEFETELWSAYGSQEVVQLRLFGENITVKNLTIKDIGTSAPAFRARNIHLDGVNNTIDGFNITASGSYPYGYGDLFGKGGNTVIPHRKHSVILIRGEENTLKNTTIQSRTYGHVVFIQGGKNVLIEDCYIEGDAMRTTDDILAEEGTGSLADNVNFNTVWGYKVPPGYMISMQEAGIRSYASADHYSGNGETSTTENVTIRNCTTKHVRSGYNLVFGGGTMIMDNCTSIENESGFAIQKGGSIINCKSDAKFGLVYTNAYESDSDIRADITITNSEGSYGNHPLAYIGGGNQNITFNSTESNVSQERSIQLGGTKIDLRLLENSNTSQNNHATTTSTIINNTKFPVLLSNVSKSNTIRSCGTVTDEGSTNFITQTTNCN